MRGNEGGDSPPEVWRAVLRSGGTRLLVLPVSAVLGILVTRLLVDNYGAAAFAQYGLLVGIGALLPFTDLGMSAAVMNAVAGSADPGRDDHVRRTLVTALRILVVSMVVLALVAGSITWLGLWPALLGEGLLAGSGPVVSAVCVVLIAAAIPLGIGQRMLVGLRQNHVSVLVLGLQTPVVLAVLLVLVTAGVQAGTAFPVVPYAVTLVLAGVCTWLAARRVRPVLGQAVRQVPRLRTERGARVFGVAWPMLVQMLALPLAMQSDRIVVSHVHGSAGLAQYNLASQMFTPIWAVVSSAGMALWPVFARARVRGTGGSPVPMAVAFAGAGAVMSVGIAVVSPWLADLASGGAVHLDPLVVVAFAGLMVLQSAKYPLGMFLTDAPGLRFQAVMILLMLPVNVGLSLLWAVRLGPAGPVLGSVVGVLVFQLLANAWYVRRRVAQQAAAVLVVPGVPARVAR